LRICFYKTNNFALACSEAFTFTKVAAGATAGFDCTYEQPSLPNFVWNPSVDPTFQMDFGALRSNINSHVGCIDPSSQPNFYWDDQNDPANFENSHGWHSGYYTVDEDGPFSHIMTLSKLSFFGNHEVGWSRPIWVCFSRSPDQCSDSFTLMITDETSM
jgi:hypothetical protein